jgi:plastocyanin
MDNSQGQIAVADHATKWSGTNHPAHPLSALLAVVIATFMPAVAAAESGPACSPSGTALSIAAKERKFDKDCLAAPADQPFTIEFDNQDSSVPHNVAIFDRTNGKKPLFKGEVIIGPNKVTYSVPAQASGTYEFLCEPHDFTMIGTFIIGDGTRALDDRGSGR